MKINDENQNDIIGYIGTFLISVNLIPQIYHIIKIKNTDSISLSSIILGVLSGIFMGSYGILINKFPVIISNTAVTVFYIIIFLLKLQYNYSSNKIEFPLEIT
jgi:MtN3 and saliva related transmembrane protein